MTLQVPYKIKLGLGTPACTPSLLYDCAESDHWEHRPRRRKARWCWVRLGVTHKADKSHKSHLYPTREYLQRKACKRSTFNLQKLLPTQIPQAARVGLVEQDVHSETLTEMPAQHDSVETTIHSHPLGRKLPTNCTPRRAAELSARKGNLEKEGKKERNSKFASIKRHKDLPLHSHTVTVSPAHLLYRLLHPCSPVAKDGLYLQGP